jgi:hypothetical protein
MPINDILARSDLDSNLRTGLYGRENIAPRSFGALGEKTPMDLLLDELAEIIDSEQGILIV